MWVEIVAAALVGLSLLWLVFEPMFIGAGTRPVDVIDLDPLDDLEDTRSGIALAALKEIEFDKETGKLSDADYQFLKQKYTLEALVALRADEATAPVDLEQQVAARVAAMRDTTGAGVECGRCGTHAGPGARFCPECGSPMGVSRPCGKCGIDLPSGSRFCAACGGRVAA